MTAKEKTTLKKFKIFLPWQDEREELWLQDMAARGWHLRPVRLPATYVFEKGAPMPYKYRLDYLYASQTEFPEYLQLYQDAGWEYVGQMSNWQYWRKPAIANAKDELFTDNDSKIKKYQRVTRFLVIFLVILMMMGLSIFTREPRGGESARFVDPVYSIVRLLYGLIIVLYGVTLIKLMRRIRQLKSQWLP